MLRLPHGLLFVLRRARALLDNCVVPGREAVMARKTAQKKVGKKWDIELTAVGLEHHVTATGRDKLMRVCPFHVRLEREPDNKFDPNAVMVVVADDKAASLKGIHMGYIRRASAELLAPELDSGRVEQIKLVVTEIDKKAATAAIECHFQFRV
jgi:hypothetical protein